MPYSDVKRQREAVRAWRKAHPEKVKAYRRTSMLRKAMNERRLPRTRSIEHYALTEEELVRIITNVFNHTAESRD